MFEPIKLYNHTFPFLIAGFLMFSAIVIVVNVLFNRKR